MNIPYFVDNLFNKDYDLFIPFGRSCHSAMILKSLDLRFCSMPFDWLIPVNYDSEPLDFRFKLFYNFSDFFNKEDYIFNRDKITTSGHYSVYNIKYGFEIGHDFELNLSDDENFSDFKIKYLKRFKRMWNLIDYSNRICFIYMSKTMDQMGIKSCLDLEIIEENIDKLNKKYSSKTFDFVIFEHNPKLRKNEIKVKKYKNITKYISNHTIHKENNDVLSETLSINKVLSKYKLYK